MTETPAAPEAPPDPRERFLQRSAEGRMLTGVCAGLGRFSGMDPVLFRVGFAILVLGSGIGIFLYIAAFLLMRETDGRPGYLEQWTRRIFDAETVLALLTAVFAFGLIINMASGGIGRGTIVVGTLLAVALLAAHARGVDLVSLARSLPDRMTGRRGMSRAPESAFTRPSPFPPPPPPFRPEPAMPPTPGPYGAAPQPEGYRSLADLAREARGAAFTQPSQAYGSAEPFAPRGPYARKPMQEPEKKRPREVKQKRPKSFVGGLTICLALIVGGIMVAVQQSGTGTISLPIIGGAVLVTIGAGLLVATWFGRGAALIAAGTIVSLVLVAGASVSGLPKKVGSYTWHPVDVAQAAKTYTVGIGEGRLDLSDLKLPEGSRTRFDASISLGQLIVLLPPDARVEVFGYTRLGDIKIDHQVEDGTDVTFNRVLDPEVPPKGDAAVIELYVKAGIGDVEVRRAA
ncbi:PspC domain-containing protein [Acrocarpospora catenulata]|uniref:PspC domain-containing protein n=1 Tax=Acrocarpospora catenulata TaxID=2836182 RepID=UPI001BDA430E|nr:PspC domain-containing protein [Acrocarpospora catenulata]